MNFAPTVTSTGPPKMTSTSIKFKCKSWIETFGQRGSKAAGSLITNAFADDLPMLAE